MISFNLQELEVTEVYLSMDVLVATKIALAVLKG